MVAYNIKYTLKSDPTRREILVEASNLMYAKKKIARKHGYKASRMVTIESVGVVGYM